MLFGEVSLTVREALGISEILGGVYTTRCERNSHANASILGGLLDGSSTTQDDEIGERYPLTYVGGVELILNLLEL